MNGDATAGPVTPNDRIASGLRIWGQSQAQQQTGSEDGASSAGAAGGNAGPTRRPTVRALLQRLGSSFTRPGDDLGTHPRIQLQITTSGPLEQPPLLAATQLTATQQDGQAGSLANQQLQQVQQPAPLDGTPELTRSLSVDVAAAAEQHRLLSSSIDVRQLAMAVEKALPFLTLLLLLFVYQHIAILALLAWLTWVLFKVNTILRAQVALKQDLKRSQLLAAAGIVAVQLPLVLLGLKQTEVFDILLLHGMPSLGKFWETLFLVATADLLARYSAVLMKVGLMLTLKVDTPVLFRRRGSWLTATEYSVAVYRSFLPAAVWYRFYRTEAAAGLLSHALAGVYGALKAANMYERLALASLALRQAALGGAQHGVAPSQDEVMESGNSCQEVYRSPVRLPCAHIFCADCIGEWMERDQGGTCPCCRAVVHTTRLRPRADASTSLLPVLF